MDYYSEIMKELDLLPSDSYYENIKRGCGALFSACHKYARVCKISEDIDGVKNVLSNYMDEENLLKNIARERKWEAEKREEPQKDSNGIRKRSKGLDMITKLYIECFWKCYKKYYKSKSKDDFCEEVIVPCKKGKSMKKIWDEIFSKGEKMNLSYLSLTRAFDEWFDLNMNAKGLDELNLDNLHNAMDVLGKSLNTTDISIEDSVEEVLHIGVLEYILSALKMKKYPHCQFLIAPVTRALTTGEIKSYTPSTGNTSIYFNVKSEYNLAVLQEYIEKLQDLYDEYIETKQELEKIIYEV